MLPSLTSNVALDMAAQAAPFFRAACAEQAGRFRTRGIVTEVRDYERKFRIGKGALIGLAEGYYPVGPVKGMEIEVSGIRFADDPPGTPQRYDFSRAHILEAVDGSLRRLGTDYLDILLLHRPDVLWEGEEVAAGRPAPPLVPPRPAHTHPPRGLAGGGSSAPPRSTRCVIITDRAKVPCGFHDPLTRVRPP